MSNRINYDLETVELEEMQQGDLAIHEDGDIYIASSIDVNHYNLISLDDGNHYFTHPSLTVESLGERLLKGHWKIYRGCIVDIKLGKRVNFKK